MKISNLFKKIFSGLLLIMPASVLFSQSMRPVVTGINAYAYSAGKISIDWILPKENSTVSSFLIYRTSRPVTSYSQLEFIEPVASVPKETESYIDDVRASKEYFYTIITMTSETPTQNKGSDLYYDEQLDPEISPQNEKPLALVLPGVNSTVEGVKSAVLSGKTSIGKQSPQKKEYDNKMREKPLPYIDILEDNLKDRPSEISEASRQKIQELLKETEKQTPKALPVHIFNEDFISPAGGDEYLLFEILRTSFIKKKYSDSITSLRQFLAQNRKKEVANRASFYLGESYYYTGNLPAALTQFLALEETYPELCRKWIENTLDNFSIEQE